MTGQKYHNYPDVECVGTEGSIREELGIIFAKLKGSEGQRLRAQAMAVGQRMHADHKQMAAKRLQKLLDAF